MAYQQSLQTFPVKKHIWYYICRVECCWFNWSKIAECHDMSTCYKWMSFSHFVKTMLQGLQKSLVKLVVSKLPVTVEMPKQLHMLSILYITLFLVICLLRLAMCHSICCHHVAWTEFRINSLLLCLLYETTLSYS